MTKSDFIEQLTSPELLNKTHIQGLQKIVHDFPYCQSAHVLLTKAFHVSENLNFESELKKTAAYASDRKQLHQLLFVESEPNITEESNSTTAGEVIRPEEVVIIDQIQEDNADSFKDDFLEKQIVTSAINNSILLEVSNDIPDISELSNKDKEYNEEQIESNLDPINEFNEDENHSFSEWLNFFGNDNAEISSSINLVIENESSSRNRVRHEQNSTVQEKADFYSASKMAKLSVQENDDLVTETLATIYTDQGNFEKAIKAFEKLQLKYPEKRVYFAGRIKKIQNQLNS